MSTPSRNIKIFFVYLLFSALNQNIVNADSEDITNINETHIEVSNQSSFSVAKRSQTISFTSPSGMTPAAGDQDLTVTASSGLTVSLTSLTPTICSIVSGPKVSVSSQQKEGTCRIRASQSGDLEYKAAVNVDKSFSVAKRSQTISFTSPSGMTPAAGDQDLTVTASSGLTVSLTSLTPTICSIVSGPKVSVSSQQKEGTCRIRASQSGDLEYKAAVNVDKSFSVAKRSQTISFTSPSGMTPAAGDQDLTVTASSGLTVSLTSLTPTICSIVSGPKVSVSSQQKEGTCRIRASQSGDLEYKAAVNVDKSFSVAKRSQTISFTSPSGMTPAAGDQDLTVTASSGLTVSLTSLTPTICSIVSGPKVSVSSQQKEGTCRIRASQSGDLEYKAAVNVDKSFSVLGKCSTYGSVISNYLGTLECRQIINNSGRWVQVEEISTIPEDSNLEALVDLAECKINDQRSVQTQPWNIAFPFNGWFGLNRVDGDSAPGPGLVGSIKIAIIPVDFPNKIGSGNPKSTIDEVDLLIDDWEQYFTRGNLELEIVSTPNWIRAGKNSTYYNTPHGSYTTTTQLKELINLSDPYIDFKDVKYIYFLFPSGSQVQTYGLSQNIDSSYTTDLGSSVLISHFGFSNYKNDSTKNLTIFGDLIHEWSHPAGFAGHAPGNGSVLWGYTPRTWEAVLAGWLNEINEEAICVDKNKLNSSGYVFNLAPWDLGNISGTKTIIVKFDNSNLLVIESRRVSKFMPEIFKGFYGLNVYNIDSTKDTDRCDSCNQLTRINNSYSKYIPIQNGKRGNILNTSLNWIVFEGESVVSNGIKIKLQNTGVFDKVEISTN